MGREELLGSLDEGTTLVRVSSDGMEREGLDARKPAISARRRNKALAGSHPNAFQLKELGVGVERVPRREERRGERTKGAWNPEFAFTTTPRPESGAFSLLPAMSLAGDAGRTDARRTWGRGRGCGWGRPAPSLRAGKRGLQSSLIPPAAREQLWSSA